MIDAETYEDLNRAFVKLAGVISHARYTGDRSGMIPVDAMGDMVVEMANAYHTISELWMSQTVSTHAESKDDLDVTEWISVSESGSVSVRETT